MSKTKPAPPSISSHSAELRSPNFQFLAKHHAVLVGYAALAERYLFDDPNTSLLKLRQFAELLARQACANVGIQAAPTDEFIKLLNMLRDRGVLSYEPMQLFNAIRSIGNQAAHDGKGTQSEALYHLQLARQLAIWFDRSFGTGKQPYGAFVPPPNPAHVSSSLAAELDRLREDAAKQQAELEQLKFSASEEAALRQKSQADAEKAYAELNVAIELAAESEAKLDAEKKAFEKQLAEVQAAAAQKPSAEVEAVLQRIRKAASLVVVDEATTRKMIDEQLRQAGWEADSDTLRHSLGVRPQKGRNLAIAEWPTAEGPADYVLFLGLTPLAAVEAKKVNVDVAGKIGQAKRYSEGFSLADNMICPGGRWQKYGLPFVFSTNGRPYLRQLETKSGIWFCDVRQPANLSRALEGWYTPEGLESLLDLDAVAAEGKLASEPTDYLPLRDYQLSVVEDVEDAIAEGRRSILVSMATGTGKTITCLGLIYRLLKSGRFRRILFLVDRTSLEQQAFERFEAQLLEGLKPITSIYDVKRLDDIVPEPDTRLHFGTVQGMVQRVLYTEDPKQVPPVDAYDCVIIDECHRGYTVDRELSDSELTFRDEADYVSKYRRVLDHFDAVKIGLTATPAHHTEDIFGTPVAEYTYRQAVIDGWLVDHEPPLQIITKLGRDGIRWSKGEIVEFIIPSRGLSEIHQEAAPDQVNIEIDEFHKKVITKNYNKVVCEVLASEIDPSDKGKTIVFCVNDVHADMVVDLLKKAFVAQYGSVEEDAVLKITGKADRPLKLIKRFQNERLPNVAVTVDLLTTGIDVPSITNLVFLRRVRSRILYEQMLGRGTRLCDDLFGPKKDKTSFRVFDAVNLYAALLPHSQMRPVVTRPNVPFTQLVAELQALTDADARTEVQDQLLAKLRAKRRVLESTEENREDCEKLTGMPPGGFVRHIASLTPEAARDWFKQRPVVAKFLDEIRPEGGRTFISSHEDNVIRVERGYGANGQKPADYLESFRAFVAANREKFECLKLVTKRPRDLTRQSLKELKVALQEAGFTETQLQTAWRETRNEDIAATILGYVRHVMTGEPLLSYKERVAAAMKKILAVRPWTQPQRKWLERIGKQLESETVVDRNALDQGQFQNEGGFTRLNKVFNGELESILGQIIEAMWPVAA